MTKVNFVRMSWPQGAYVFSSWLKDEFGHEYIREVQVFDDNKRDAKKAAVQMLREEEKSLRCP